VVIRKSVEPVGHCLFRSLSFRNLYNPIIWLNWSALKRSFLFGSLSGSNFPEGTAKMDRSRKDLAKSCLRKILEERTVLHKVESLFLLSCL